MKGCEKKMKTFKLTSAITLTSALLLGGCGNSSEHADKPNREDADIIHEHEKEGGSMDTGGGYGFSTFDLEIDFDGKDAIDVDYDVTQRAEADFENRLRNTKLTGVEAMNQLNKLFVDIHINKDTPQQEVIERILEWYQLDSYSKFDLEVNFDNGTTLTIEDKK